MDPADLSSFSKEFLRIVEDSGLAGSWQWSLASGEQRWSSGFFRLLGLDMHPVDATYELFRDLVHPDDRALLASAEEIRQGCVSPKAIVRLIRPSGDLRILSVASQLRVSPEGRPLGVSGAALDVTDRERLRRMLAAEERRRQALYLTTYAATYFLGPDLVHEFSAEVAQVHGLSLA
ncbi:PAS domain-containing protein, partial [Methylobacterium platani]